MPLMSPKHLEAHWHDQYFKSLGQTEEDHRMGDSWQARLHEYSLVKTKSVIWKRGQGGIL